MSERSWFPCTPGPMPTSTEKAATVYIPCESFHHPTGLFHASTSLTHTKAAGCGVRDTRRGAPHPQPSQARPPAALYRTCVSAAPGWAGSRFSWPGPAGRRPWRAERPWPRVRGPSREARATPEHATLTAPSHRPCRKPRVRRHRRPSAEPPARGA